MDGAWTESVLEVQAPAASVECIRECGGLEEALMMGGKWCEEGDDQQRLGCACAVWGWMAWTRNTSGERGSAEWWTREPAASVRVAGGGVTGDGSCLAVGRGGEAGAH